MNIPRFVTRPYTKSDGYGGLVYRYGVWDTEKKAFVAGHGKSSQDWVSSHATAFNKNGFHPTEWFVIDTQRRVQLIR